MLILAEGVLQRPSTDAELASIHAWTGPMVDEGFVQSGYVDAGKLRIWLVISADSAAAAARRLNDLPMVGDGAVRFTLTPVTAFRYR